MAGEDLRKYPRTPHIVGSRLQDGDEDLTLIPAGELLGRHIVIEEKVDGANCAVSFGRDGALRLQSRGHYLTGGPNERQFARLKAWAAQWRDALWRALGSRYIMYGEWLYAKHTVFYDMLPGYLLEFDVLDTGTEHFLDTPRRRELLAGLPLQSVPLLFAGTVNSTDELLCWHGQSRCCSADPRPAFALACRAAGVDAAQAAQETDVSGRMEGLYCKVEEEGRVVARAKWVSAHFRQQVVVAEHWQKRLQLVNRLAPGGPGAA